MIRQSRQYVPYQPGKAKLVLMSVMLTNDSSDVPGAVTRVGVFDGLVVDTFRT